MKEIHYSSKAKKDLKRCRHKESLMKVLFKILQYLTAEEEIPTEYFPHNLRGDYKGCMECHVENDFLLIWTD